MRQNSRLARWVLGAGLTTLLAVPASHAAEPDPHAHHQMAMQAEGSSVRRSLAQYPLADQKLVRQDGKPASLITELDDGRPVYLNFIYTTCTTICPLSSQVFSLLQQKLGDDRKRVHLMSVSIDPEQDTPARLAAYAARYHAGEAWTHYTGTLEASVAVQRAFNAYRGDKMNHTPLTLYRAAPGQQWVRLDGFATADQLLAEFRPSVARGR